MKLMNDVMGYTKLQWKSHNCIGGVFFFFFFQLSGNGINNSWKILWPYSSFGLLQLAGSDINKTNIIEKQGMDRLMKLSARFSEDSSMLQEV